MSSASTSAVCTGMASSSATCSACANLGKGTALSGSTASTCVLAATSPCCNLPVFYLDFTGSTATRYPLIELNVLTNVRAAERETSPRNTGGRERNGVRSAGVRGKGTRERP